MCLTGSPAVSTESYLPEDGDDEALWHVRHGDGDEEDLDESEVGEAFRALAQNLAVTDEDRAAWGGGNPQIDVAAPQMQQVDSEWEAYERRLMAAADKESTKVAAWAKKHPAGRSGRAKARPKKAPAPSPKAKQGAPKKRAAPAAQVAKSPKKAKPESISVLVRLTAESVEVPAGELRAELPRPLPGMAWTPSAQTSPRPSAQKPSEGGSSSKVGSPGPSKKTKSPAPSKPMSQKQRKEVGLALGAAAAVAVTAAAVARARAKAAWKVAAQAQAKFPMEDCKLQRMLRRLGSGGGGSDDDDGKGSDSGSGSNDSSESDSDSDSDGDADVRVPLGAKMQAVEKAVRLACRVEICQIFADPVDLDVFTDYLDHVDTPMALRTVLRKVRAGAYSDPCAMRGDFALIHQN